MATLRGAIQFLALFNLLLLLPPQNARALTLDDPLSADHNKAVYIVYMGSKGNAAVDTLLATQRSTLMDAFASEEEASSSVIYSYKHAFSGFSARLTSKQAAHIADMPGVVSVFKSRKLDLHTTESWQYLGLTAANFKGMWDEPSSDVIVGVLDTGIWPESESFRDHSMGPVPSRWKGECENDQPGKPVICNRKIIGVRSYYDGLSTASAEDDNSDYTNGRDSLGHGTHTASTIAGRVVEGASLFGLCEGNARGGLPKARLAIYKVCFFGDCLDHSVLAAFDDAVRDGVDILSVSLGGQSVPYDEDTIAIGSFHAVRHGILVSCSAGNAGPFPSTVTNIAPWILTVGASSTSRRLLSAVQLGSGELVEGAALNVKNMSKASYPLVYAGDAGISGSTKESARSCGKGTLDASKVRDKIVLCSRGLGIGSRLGNSSAVLHKLGAAGVIQINDLATDVAFSFSLPATIIRGASGQRIISYINSTSNPTATILPTRTLSDNPHSPQVAVFSSRGPSGIRPEFLKPDVLAPGLNILAAWTPDQPAIKNLDEPSVFNVLSGTSMSCPHATGAAAFIKSIHPDWSPSMIKSALITTASRLSLTDYNGKEVSPFDSGAGLMSPLQASDPGLVYDVTMPEYTDYLCALGYRSRKLRIITGQSNVSCSGTSKAQDLNYPTITLHQLNATSQTVTRRVTNVGAAGETSYRVTVDPPPGVHLAVNPRTLEFTPGVTTREYSVEVRAEKPLRDYVFGSLVWSNGVHNVTSVVVVGGGKTGGGGLI